MWIFLLSFFFCCCCYTLPCFLLILGIEPALSFALLFIVICLFLFFFLNGFSVVFFFFVCKFNCSWHFFTSSGHVPLGVGCTAPPFRGRVSKGSKLYNWWFGKASGLIDTNWWTWYFEETVDDGLGGRCLDAGRCPVARSWLVMAGRSGRWCQLLFFSFYLLKIHGDCWQGAGMKQKVPCSTVAGFGGGEFHSAFRNIIPVTTPIELWRLLMFPRRKEKGETNPKILLNCWVGVVKIPLCSDGLENGAKCWKIE